MVFLQRTVPINPRKRSAPSAEQPPVPTTATATSVITAGGRGIASTQNKIDDEQHYVTTMISVLADAGCTLCGDGPPSFPADPLDLRRCLESRFSSEPSLLVPFLSGLSTYFRSPLNLRSVLMPALSEGRESLVRLLLLVGQLQPKLLQLLLEKLPEHFDSAGSGLLREDIARLIVNQFRWLDFLVEPNGFLDKLIDVLSIAPLAMKKEIIGSLPEIVGDCCNDSLVTAFQRLLQEDSDIIIPILDAFSNLNLNHELQDQAVSVALSCIRIIDMEDMPQLLRFLMLSATPTNVRRIISQIREQLKFVGAIDSRASRNKRLKGKSLSDRTEASILEAVQSSLRFKNMLCEAVLKELKSTEKPQDHKVIDVWLIMLIYMNGGPYRKSVEKLLKNKIVDGCVCEALFDQCVHAHRELVQVYFPSFVSICEYLLSCKEPQARCFGISLYSSLFEEFNDNYSRQEIVGALVTHVGSGLDYEVSSALDAMVLLTSKHPEKLIPIASHITGILDYLDGFHEENLHKVYQVFCCLGLPGRSNSGSVGSSISNELLMIVRKQVSNPDMKYKRMGIVGTLKIVSTLGDVNSAVGFSSSEKTNSQEALDLLEMSINACKLSSMPLNLLYDELSVILLKSSLHQEIIEWIGKHVGEIESTFFTDLENGQLVIRESFDGLEGELWMNLDGDLSPIGLNILPLVSSSNKKLSFSLEVLPSQLFLLSAVERLTNQGSLAGIDALLGCPLHLPSPEYFHGGHWSKLTSKQKQIACSSLYFGINWIRELLNAFSSQIADRVDSITQTTREETTLKLFKRLRNLVLMEALLNELLMRDHLSLLDVFFNGHPPAITAEYPKQKEKASSMRKTSQGTSQNGKGNNKNGLAASINTNCDDKLRQTTILDSFKKVGVTPKHSSQDQSSSRTASSVRTSQCVGCQEDNKGGPLDILAVPKILETQRFRFRSLHSECLSLLSFSKGQETCCPDSAAELPLHLYLLRDLHNKLDYLKPPRKHCAAAPDVCSVKSYAGQNRMIASELLSKAIALSTSLRKHLDCAVTLLNDGSDICEDHWKVHSTSAGNPDIPHSVVTKSSVATYVLQEVLSCYIKMLNLPDLFHQANLPILRGMLGAFQSSGIRFPSELQPIPTPGSTESLYFGTYSFLEEVLDAVSSSFLLASEVIVGLQSLLNSMTMYINKPLVVIGKNVHAGSFDRTLASLKRKLGISANKLLRCEWDQDSTKLEWRVKADILRRTLQIYVKNTETTSDLLHELGCSILYKVHPSKARKSQETPHDIPTLCPSTFLTWYRVLHEENLDNLHKLVKEVQLMSKTGSGKEVARKELLRLQQAVNVLVSLANMCKEDDKVVVHAVAVKYGGKFIDVFLKAFNFLEAVIEEHNDIIIKMIKELQKATRIIQTICSEAKGSKRTIITSKVPATKRSLERFLFHVKALLHKTNHCSFWMGNLKHKDLDGHVVSSQVYNSVNDGDAHEEDENDIEAGVADDADDRYGRED